MQQIHDKCQISTVTKIHIAFHWKTSDKNTTILLMRIQPLYHVTLIMILHDEWSKKRHRAYPYLTNKRKIRILKLNWNALSQTIRNNVRWRFFSRRIEWSNVTTISQQIYLFMKERQIEYLQDKDDQSKFSKVLSSEQSQQIRENESADIENYHRMPFHSIGCGKYWIYGCKIHSHNVWKVLWPTGIACYTLMCERDFQKYVIATAITTRLRTCVDPNDHKILDIVQYPLAGFNVAKTETAQKYNKC